MSDTFLTIQGPMSLLLKDFYALPPSSHATVGARDFQLPVGRDFFKPRTGVQLTGLLHGSNSPAGGVVEASKSHGTDQAKCRISWGLKKLLEGGNFPWRQQIVDHIPVYSKH